MTQITNKKKLSKYRKTRNINSHKLRKMKEEIGRESHLISDYLCHRLGPEGRGRNPANTSTYFH